MIPPLPLTRGFTVRLPISYQSFLFSKELKLSLSDSILTCFSPDEIWGKHNNMVHRAFIYWIFFPILGLGLWFPLVDDEKTKEYCVPLSYVPFGGCIDPCVCSSHGASHYTCLSNG